MAFRKVIQRTFNALQGVATGVQALARNVVPVRGKRVRLAGQYNVNRRLQWSTVRKPILLLQDTQQPSVNESLTGVQLVDYPYQPNFPTTFTIIRGNQSMSAVIMITPTNT